MLGTDKEKWELINSKGATLRDKQRENIKEALIKRQEGQTKKLYYKQMYIIRSSKMENRENEGKKIFKGIMAVKFLELVKNILEVQE